MVRIGVVTEGPTDTHATITFLKSSLEDRGLETHFVKLQPDMDRTKPVGGWGMVVNWLKTNPPEVRVKSYLGGGLFDNEMSAKRCDAIVVQMDSDILSDEPFRNRMRKCIGREVRDPETPIDRGREICTILEVVGRVSELTQVDREKHMVMAAVESTETWCIAAFSMWDDNPELLRGDVLRDRFMDVLHESEGRPMRAVARIDKSPGRRLKFCGKYAASYGSLEQQCHHFKELVEKLDVLFRNG